MTLLSPASSTGREHFKQFRSCLTILNGPMLHFRGTAFQALQQALPVTAPVSLPPSILHPAPPTFALLSSNSCGPPVLTGHTYSHLTAFMLVLALPVRVSPQTAPNGRQASLLRYSLECAILLESLAAEFKTLPSIPTSVQGPIFSVLYSLLEC